MELLLSLTIGALSASERLALASSSSSLSKKSSLTHEMLPKSVRSSEAITWIEASTPLAGSSSRMIFGSDINRAAKSISFFCP